MRRRPHVRSMIPMSGSFFEDRAGETDGHANPHGRRGEPTPWSGPGESELIDVRVLGNTVAQSDTARVMLKSISYFTSGYLLDFTASAESGRDLRDKAAIIAWRRKMLESMKVEHADGLPVGLLRIELHLANGRKLTPLDHILPPAEAPKSPIMREIAGAGYAASESGIWIDPKMWIWPVINEPVLMIVAWPDFGIGPTESALDFGQPG